MWLVQLKWLGPEETMRNILSRASMDKPTGENMTPATLFGVLAVPRGEDEVGALAESTSRPLPTCLTTRGRRGSRGRARS